MPESPARNDGAAAADLREHLASQVAALAAALPYLAEVDPVHDVRVRARRLRSLLRSNRGFLPPGWDGQRLDELLGGLRWLGRTVGELRDLDVLTEHLALVDAPAVARDRWLADLHDQRVAALVRVEEVLDGPRAADLLIGLRDLVVSEGWLESSTPSVADVLPAQRIRVLDRADRATALRARRSSGKPSRKVSAEARRLDSREVTAWHDVRKAAKELRYAAEAFTAHDPGATRWASAGRRLQTVLGRQLDREGVAAWLDAFARRHRGEPDLAAVSRAQAKVERGPSSRRNGHARKAAVAAVRDLI